MPTIRPLPTSVVNKIAAGEVIERPASVVKELLENAVDSGATRVDVAIEKGGAELIRVVDNGCGIAADELPLAVTNHATSKIESADDLFRVGTLGFRGEALASISEVSRFTMRSRQEDADAGNELVVHGGAAQPIEPAGCPVGTTVEVRQLFFNTPVRQKFLRTPQTEIGHCTEALARVAIAHPAVHFTLAHNGRPVHDLPAADDWRGRIGALFGGQVAQSLIAVDSTDELEGENGSGSGGGGEVRLSGYVANPTESRANNRLQYLLLNGRAIRDRSLQHALSEAYRGLLLSGRYPICFLRLDMPADRVDVNVHPTKLEVRFADGGRLYSQLLGTLRNKFLTSDLKPVAGEAKTAGQTTDEEIDEATGPAGKIVDWAKNELQQRRIDLEHQQPPASSLSASGGGGATPPFKPYPSSGGGLAGAGGDGPLAMHRFTPAAEAAARGDAPVALTTTAAVAPAGTPTAQAATSGRAIQLHNRYLVLESEAGLEVIDQHALHERILYEQIRERVLSGALESQTLLVPEPVELTPEEAAAVLANTELLKRLGVAVEPFGGDTVLVSSYPAMLANLPPAEVLRDLVDKLLAGGKAPDTRDLLDDLLHSVSCKAAVKYGDRLTPEEINALLAQRHVTENHHHCPHGRPTALVFTCDELDKRFKRI